MTTIETRYDSGVRSLRDTDGGVLFWAYCAEVCDVDAGCLWILHPDYRRGGWTAQHGRNDEAVLRFERPDGAAFDPASMLDTLFDWLDRVHEYEGSS